jgi:hypothetical protein
MRFIKHKAGRGGWSNWVFPENRYFLKCCDCGLVHEAEFKTFLEKDRKGKIFEVISLPKEIRVMFRLRRAKK